MDNKSDHPDKKGAKALKSNIYDRKILFAGSKTGQTFSLENSVYHALTEFSKEKKMFLSLPKTYVDYVPPKLHRGKTSWYISYYVKNPETEKMKLFRIKCNHFSNAREKALAAKEIMSALQEKLSLGWNPMLEQRAPLSSNPALETLDTFLNAKSKEMEAQSVASYRSYINILKEFLEKEGFTESSLICSINENLAKKFMTHLELERKVSPRTYNNYLSFAITLFDWLKDKGFVHQNFFISLKKKPKRLMKKTRRILTEAELYKLIKFCQQNNPEFLVICMLCYCCLIRPKEIALLRCSDIDEERQLVHVRAEIAKNDHESYRTIPDSMMPLIRQLDLSKPEWFLFGYHPNEPTNFKPADGTASNKRFSDFWAHQVRDACGFSNDIQLYSLKDTGITNMLEKGMAINLVQQQADHSSVAMTAIYVGHKATASEEIKSALSLP